jgi:hypothetical protein
VVGKFAATVQNFGTTIANFSVTICNFDAVARNFDAAAGNFTATVKNFAIGAHIRNFQLRCNGRQLHNINKQLPLSVATLL